MKTPEEIDTIAWKFYVDKDGIVPNTYEREGFTNGYTQCQEDMVEKYTEQDILKFAFDTYYQEDMAKKYTEEDVRNAFNAGDAWGRADYNTYFSILINPNQPFPDEDEYINSLNKQD